MPPLVSYRVSGAGNEGALSQRAAAGPSRFGLAAFGAPAAPGAVAEVSNPPVKEKPRLPPIEGRTDPRPDDGTGYVVPHGELDGALHRLKAALDN